MGAHMFKRFIARVVGPLFLLAGLSFGTAGCLPNGTLNPVVPAIVGGAAPVCSLVGVLSGNTVVGSVCADVVEIVQGILNGVKGASLTAAGPGSYVGLYDDGRLLGVIRVELEPKVREALLARKAALKPSCK